MFTALCFNLLSLLLTESTVAISLGARETFFSWIFSLACISRVLAVSHTLQYYPVKANIVRLVATALLWMHISANTLKTQGVFLPEGRIIAHFFSNPGAMSWFVHLEKFSLNFSSLSFCNPC